MEVTAEVRVWWSNSNAELLKEWFDGLSEFRPGGRPLSESAEPRQDLYLCHPGMGMIGIKLRSAESESAEAEFKTLFKSGREEQGFGPITCWVKAAARGVRLDPARTVAVTKQRSLRRFAWRHGSLAELALNEEEKPLTGSDPPAGCDLELTRVRIEGSESAWHTVCFEAFGGRDLVEPILRECIRQVAGHSPPPRLERAEAASFPEFIGKIGCSRSR